MVRGEVMSENESNLIMEAANINQNRINVPEFIRKLWRINNSAESEHKSNKVAIWVIDPQKLKAEVRFVLPEEVNDIIGK